MGGGVSGSGTDPTAMPAHLAAVADAAAIMARAASENFPVAGAWLPRRLRAHLLAVYGFARLVDEFGDTAPGDRLAALDWLEGELDLAFTGSPTHPLLITLTTTIRECRLTREPFARLLAANRHDQQTASYRRFEDVLDYCHLSANPIGELVLEIFGAATPARIALSNDVCTALQLIEHWQDIAEDLERGRVYVPLEDLARHDCTLDDLQAPRVGEGLRRVLALQATRTSLLLDRGTTLTASLHGWPRLAVAGFAGGGRAALSALARADYEVLALTPRPSRRRTIGSILRVLNGAGR